MTTMAQIWMALVIVITGIIGLVQSRHYALASKYWLERIYGKPAPLLVLRLMFAVITAAWAAFGFWMLVSMI